MSWERSYTKVTTPAHSATATAPNTAIKVPERALEVGLPLAWVAPALALGVDEGVGVVGKSIPRTLLPEVAISRVF